MRVSDQLLNSLWHTIFDRLASCFPSLLMCIANAPVLTNCYYSMVRLQM